MDPFVALARASGVTTTLKLATGIVLVPERHPVLLAKEVATLDMYSGGRFLFGHRRGLEPGGERDSGRRLRSPLVPGAGVSPGDEGALDQGRERVPRQVLRLPAGLLVPEAGPAAAPARAAGRHGAQRLPPSRGLRRRLAAQPCHAGGRGRRGRATLDELASAAGRDPESIQITVFGQQPDSDLLKRFEEAGADRVTIRLETADESESLANAERIAEAVFG